MLTKNLTIFPASLLVSTLLACSSSVNAGSGSSTSSSAVSSSSSSEIVFSGNNGIHEVNGDKVEVRDGLLRVNGISYGRVKNSSVVKYSVNGDKRILTVDGLVRHPEK